VLHSLPWIGQELNEKKTSEFGEMLNAIEAYMAQRQILHAQILRVWSSSKPHPQVFNDNITNDCNWMVFRRNISNVSGRKLQNFVLMDGKKDIYRGIMSHSMPCFAKHCSTIYRGQCWLIIIEHDHVLISFVPAAPSVIFRLFDYTDCPENVCLVGCYFCERSIAFIRFSGSCIARRAFD
jgi:nuclear cap-binding protein subunit 1